MRKLLAVVLVSIISLVVVSVANATPLSDAKAYCRMESHSYDVDDEAARAEEGGAS